MAVYFESEGVDFPPINKKATDEWIRTVAEVHGKKVGEISYLFCSDEQILEVNRQYLQHDYYTDIITFDYSEESIISGDIFISTDTVRSNSDEYKTDYLEELHRVIIHGVLHLCGMKDETQTQERAMREAENYALSLISDNPLQP